MVDPQNPSFSSKNGLLLSKDETEIIHGVSRNVVIPDTVRKIGSSAFSLMTGISKTIIPDSVEIIDLRAFAGSDIEEINFGSGIQEIRLEAFNGCSKLDSVILPVASYGSNVFQGSGLTSAFLEDGTTSIGSGLFSGCRKLRNVLVPEGVTSIQQYAFSNCQELGQIVLPATLNDIGLTAFGNCSSLSSVYFKGPPPTVFQNNQYPSRNSFYGIAEGAVAYVSSEEEGWPEDGTEWNSMTIRRISPSEFPVV